MKEKNRILSVLFAFLTIFVTVFIFSNSFANGEASHNFSNTVIDLFFLRKLLDNEIVHFVVRKAAHVIEFALLGASSLGLTIALQKQYQKHFYGFSLFYVLFVAVIDEHIQKFSYGRTSSTSDILLDFFGALIGFILVFLVRLLIIIYRKKKCANSNANQLKVTN